MTCIVGLEHKGHVYIGGDTLASMGNSISSRRDEKVFYNGPLLIGFTSSYRMGQLLRYKFNPPKQTTNQDDMAYMVSSFIDDVRTLFRDNGYSYDEQGDTGGRFLVGYNKKLYRIDTDYQVGIPRVGYEACGCGHDLAKGAMHALHALSKSKITPEARIRAALDAASEFSGGVAPPYTILKSK